MCNRVRNSYEPETLHTHFGTVFSADRPMDNRFNPVELMPRSRAYVIREEDGPRGLDRRGVLAGDRQGDGVV